MPQGDRSPIRIWLSGFGSDNMMPLTSKCQTMALHGTAQSRQMSKGVAIAAPYLPFSW